MCAFSEQNCCVPISGIVGVCVFEEKIARNQIIASGGKIRQVCFLGGIYVKICIYILRLLSVRSSHYANHKRLTVVTEGFYFCAVIPLNSRGSVIDNSIKGITPC